MKHILIVDDEAAIRDTVFEVLEDEGYQPLTAADGDEALSILQTRRVELVLLDIWLPGMGGMDILEKIHETYPAVTVVIISGHGTVNLAVEAIKKGAFDFIEKPLSIERLLLVLEKASRMKQLEEENRSLRNSISKEYTMIGESDAMNGIREVISNTARSNGRVLITGENGTGKEMIARNIHRLSDRAEKPFVEVNCAAIPENLIESELFGHEKGAFTGAVGSKQGKFELADKGTIFLDEIADMSLPTQAKVLRVLQEMAFEHVGGVKTITVDVRVIAATNKDLAEEIRRGNFREDLYYRLNVIPIHIPPLRERLADITPLVEYFMEQFCVLNNKKTKQFTKRALSLFLQHKWPGNIRELRNMVERIIIMIPAQKIDKDDILPFFLDKQDFSRDDGLEMDNYDSLKEARDAFEREYIKRKLIENNMNVSQTARALGIERSNLHRKINSLQINPLKE